MDKYEYKIRSEEIKELIAQKEYIQAAEIADTIDWRRVKSVMMLCTISDLYKINRRYEDSHDLLLLAYDRHPGGRTIVYALCELSIKMGNVTQAWEYYKEYMQIAPKDPSRYILQYKIYEAEEVNLEERIAVLEELKKRDYRERWAYELAYLYHRIGLASKCVDECDEMIVWFGDGKYVIKAMELKMLHQPLSPDQQEKYDNRFAPQQEELSLEEETSQEEVQQETEEVPAEAWPEEQSAPADNIVQFEVAQTRRVPVEEIDIQVKTMDPSQCNTINLQEEVAAGLREILEESPDAEITRALVAPMMETDSVDNHAVEAAVSAKATAAEAVPEEAAQEAEAVQEVIAEAVVGTAEAFEETAQVQEAETAEQSVVESEMHQEPVEEAPTDENTAGTAETVMEQLRQERTAEPPKEMAEVLSMEADGQISFIMQEKEAIEKQITGQISIADIMAEWERKKKEIEEKGKEKIRQNVKRDTGQMFTEFEASIRDGLLEQLERGRDTQSVLAEAEGRTLDEDGVAIPPSLLEEAIPESVEEEAFVEDYESISEEEAIEAVAYAEVPVEPEPAEEAVPEEELAEEMPELAEEVTEPTEEVAEPPEEIAEQAEEIPVEAFLEPMTKEEVQESAMQPVAEEEVQQEVEEEVIDQLVEAVLTDEDEVEELVEIDDFSEEDESEAESMAVTEEVREETVTEEVFEEDAPEELSEFDAAYEEALQGAEEQAEEKTSKDIEYDTISVPAAEVDALIQEEAAKLRSLTREERELFGPFIQGRNAKQQLVQTIDNISMAAYTGNVIITGTEGLDTLGLAKSLIRNIQLTDSNFSGKIAKISGDSLNKRDVVSVLEGLDNGALIIQKAAAMNKKTTECLHKALQQEHRGIVVILEGTKKAMNTFMAKHEDLKTCFTGRIDMEALSEAALISFAKKYAREQEYTIDEFGGLALSRKIAERQTSDHAVTIMEVKEIVDAAIESANRKTFGHFIDVLTSKRYDEEDMIIIREKDFR